MSIRENPYFTHPRSLDEIHAELQRQCPAGAAGLSLNTTRIRAHGHRCVPGEGAVGVWVDREAAPAGKRWTRAVFYTVHADSIYVEEITDVAWSNSDITGQAAAWLQQVQHGTKEEHRVDDSSQGRSGAVELPA